MFESRVKLGNRVRDPITGLAGIITSIAHRYTGNVQVYIQPAGEGATIPEGTYMDDHVLEIVDEGFASRLPAMDPTVKVKLGNMVKDKISGVKGIAVEAILSQNGCVFFMIQPKNGILSVSSRKSDVQFIDHNRLEIVSEGHAEDKEKPPVQKADPVKPPTGAPMRRGMMRPS